jgi:thioredoxin reductase (NADPH)
MVRVANWGVQMSKPALVVVDDEEDVRRALTDDLNRRYNADYDVISESTPTNAQLTLKRLKAQGKDVALIITDYWMPRMNGVEFLREIRGLHPDAKHLLLIDLLDTSPSADIAQAMTLGHLDYYLTKPGGCPRSGFTRPSPSS